MLMSNIGEFLQPTPNVDDRQKKRGETHIVVNTIHPDSRLGCINYSQNLKYGSNIRLD